MLLSQNPLFRLLTLCSLYIAQGLPFGFVTVTLVAYLSEKGLTKTETGLIVSMVTLPWSFKFCWGPVIDSIGIPSMGKRRPWILLAQTLMAVTLGAMILIPDITTAVKTLAALIFIHNVFGSLQDVSVDALAVDLLEDGERGRVSGLMYAASYFGSFLGGAVLGIVLARTNLRFTLIVQVVILLGIMCLPLLSRERAGEKLMSFKIRLLSHGKEGASAIRSVLNLLKAFSLPATLLAALVAFICRFGSGVVSVVVPNEFVNSLGWTQEDYSVVMGGWATGFGLAGSVLGGFVADMLGVKKSAAASTILIGLLWIGFAYSPHMWGTMWFTRAFLCSQEFLLAFLIVSLFSMFMTVSWPVVAATQFTSYMALMNLSTTTGAASAGWLDEQFGFANTFVCIGLIQIGLAVVLSVIDPSQTRRVLGSGEDDEAEQTVEADEDWGTDESGDPEAVH